MAWIAPVAGAVIGGIMNSGSGGKNAGGTSSERTPWAAAQPWLMQNIAQGQALQNQYAARPISARQQASLDNQYAQSDYMRGLIPGLLGQLQGQPVGYDRANPAARPKAWDWNTIAGGLGQRAVSGVTDAPIPPPPPPKFVQQDMGYTPQQQALLDSGRSPWLMGYGQNLADNTGLTGATRGGYGAYKYGDKPQPGTPAYRDMQEFFLMGGNDPQGLSALGVQRYAAPIGWFGGTTSGDSIGGSPAGDGSGGGGPGAAGGGVW